MASKCFVCKRKFKDNDLVLVAQRYVTNERRGDFVSNGAGLPLHARCAVNEDMKAGKERVR